MLESSVCVDSLGELGIDAVSMSLVNCLQHCDQGVIIPTSIGLIQYGVATGTSISDLFMAGFLPGIFICLVLGVVAHFLCKKQGFEPSERAATEEKVQAFKDAILALLMPVIISYLH